MQKLAQALAAAKWWSQDSDLDSLMQKSCTIVLQIPLQGSPPGLIPVMAAAPGKRPFIFRDLLGDSCLSQYAPL